MTLTVLVKYVSIVLQVPLCIPMGQQSALNSHVDSFGSDVLNCEYNDLIPLKCTK